MHSEVLRRKLARWSNDNAAGLKYAKPLLPAAFISRPADNWTLLLAIAELAGDDWAERARAARIRLSQDASRAGSSGCCKSCGQSSSRRAQGRHQQAVAHVADGRSDLGMVSVRTWTWSPCHRAGSGGSAAQQLHVRPHPIGKTGIRGYHRRDFFEKEIFEHFLGRDPLIRSPDPQPKKSAPQE